jgi:hypothetical protein
VPLFDLKFLGRTRGNPCRNFKSAALAAMCPNSMALTHLIGYRGNGASAAIVKIWRMFESSLPDAAGPA